MYTVTTCFARRGSSPAFISDDLPHPEGPKIRPTLKVLSGSMPSILVFQNRRLSGK